MKTPLLIITTMLLASCAKKYKVIEFQRTIVSPDYRAFCKSNPSDTVFVYKVSGVEESNIGVTGKYESSVRLKPNEIVYN